MRSGRLYEQIALKQAIPHLFYWQKWLCVLLIAYAYSRHVDVFFTLLLKLLPLYLIMGLGYIAVKVLKVERTSIARLLS